MTTPATEVERIGAVLATHRWMSHEDRSGWGDCACGELTTNDRDEHEAHVASFVLPLTAARLEEIRPAAWQVPADLVGGDPYADWVEVVPLDALRAAFGCGEGRED